MFKYISEILSQFTKTQKTMALLMVLTAIIIITIGPSLINSITTDRKELEQKITKQEVRIKSLENLTDTLTLKVRESQRSCTEELFTRESEFIKMLDEIRAEAFKYKVISKTNENIVLSKMKPNGDENVMMMEGPSQENKPDVKVDISSVLNKIDKMKKSIKRN
jgi:hypothetical protein